MVHEHPGDLAAAKFAEHTTQLNLYRELRLRAATLRAEAKTEALRVDAYSKRVTAKDCSKRSAEARIAAGAAKVELEEVIEQAAANLVARLPPEYGSWGVIKTRAYMKLLAFIAQQASARSPKLALCTTALGMMRDHAQWTDDIFAKLASIKGMPKELG